MQKNCGHYYYSATYKFNSDLQFINKQEYKAKKWKYNCLIPFEKLKLAIKNRNQYIYSLAEYFNVTTQFMRNAINFYIDKYGDFTKEALCNECLKFYD